jgi:hypothetical protein
MYAMNIIRRSLAVLAAIVSVSALIGAAVLHRTNETTVELSATTPTATAPLAGVPTGEYQDGLPVYRLPSIAVTVSRIEALAEMAREESLAMK